MPNLRVSKPESTEESTLEVVEESSLPDWGEPDWLSTVGKPHSRLEGIEKVTGRAIYTYDVRLPGQLYARVLRSPHPHARIKRIDTSAAEALPGVYTVLSSANAPEIPWYEDTYLFDTTLRLVGDEVAAVAAESEEIAEDALRLIEVEYEILPHVTSMDEAQEPDAPKVKPVGNFPPGAKKIYERGDVEAGLRQADVVIEETYTTQTVIHHAMEPHGATAFWEGDRLTLWCSTQSVFTVREMVAERLGIPMSRVRVIKEHMGGGFGAKQVSWKQDVIVALLAQETGRPVQLMLDRRAESLTVGNRPKSRQRVKLGATRDGRLTGIHIVVEQETGAYQVGGEQSDVVAIYETLYKCDNVRTDQQPVYINAGPMVAFRAPGHVEGAWGLEQAMDQLAQQLDIDPVELRRRNYSEVHQTSGKPYTLPEGLSLTYDRVTEGFGWGRPAGEPSGPTKRRGVGFAAHDWGAGGGHPPGYAWLNLEPDGNLQVITGTQDIGTGTRTGLAQVAAEELQIPMDRVRMHLGDTSRGPYSPVSSGSATQATLGPAIREAAAEVKAQLLEVAQTIMEIPAVRLSLRDGKVMVDGDPARSVEISEITGQIAPHTIQGRGARGPNPAELAVKTFGAQCAEVEVDIETGEITVLRVATAHDIGRIINPTMVDSQVVGGITQGVGYAMTEERIVDHEYGIVLNGDLEDYYLPTMADIPQMEHCHVDVPDTLANPTGAKGVGEPPLVPTAPAIANAVYNAIGIRFNDAPLSRHRIVDAIHKRRTGQEDQA